MNGEKFMTAIGGISDKYIAECADEEHLHTQKKMRLRLLIAACVAFVLLSAVLAANAFSQKQNHIVWNENADMQEIEKCYEHASMGNVIFTESLQNIFAILTPSDQNNQPEIDEKCVFAILITEATGVPKEEIYKEFVLPLGAEESYMKSGIVFLTRKQLETIKCPDNMAIILSLAAKK